MMRIRNQIHLLKAIVLSTIILLVADVHKPETEAFAFDKNITSTSFFSPVSQQAKESNNYVVSEGRARACTRYHSGGSLRLLVRAYQLAYAKYKLTPITIKYQPSDHGATIQHLGRLKKSKQRFQILTVLNEGLSKDPSGTIRRDNKHIDFCNAFLPFDGYEYDEGDEQESKILQQKIDQIEAFVSKRYPVHKG
jgi:hypothetical protein